MISRILNNLPDVWPRHLINSSEQKNTKEMDRFITVDEKRRVETLSLVTRQNEFENVEKYEIGCVFLGCYGVGKTTFVSLISRGYAGKHDATVGAAFCSREYCLGSACDNRTVTLGIWDTAGQERYASLLQNYTRNKAVAFLLFDVTRRETFDELDKWHSHLLQVCTVPEAFTSDMNEMLPVIGLIGTNASSEQWQVTKQEVEEKRKRWGKNVTCHFIESLSEDAPDKAREILLRTVKLFDKYAVTYGISHLPRLYCQIKEGNVQGHRKPDDRMTSLLRESGCDEGDCSC